jgi:WD40 repeat protein
VDYNIRIWNVVGTFSLKSIWTGPNLRVLALLTLPDGRLVSASGVRNRIWNTTSGTVSQTNTYSSRIICLASLGGGVFASGLNNSNILIHYPYNTTTQRTLIGPAPVLSLALLPSGYLASSHTNGIIRIWNYTDGSTIRDIATGGGSTIKLLSLGTNRLLYNIGMPSLDMAIRNTDDGSLITTFNSGHTNEINALTLLPNGNVVSVSSDRNCIVRDSSYAVANTIPEFGTLWAVAVLKDGRLAIGGCLYEILLSNP